VGLIYDGFSIITVSWLEAFGFCGRGEAGAFVADRGRSSLGRELTINPHGGQLSEGRTHGFGFLHEAALQLWGDAGDRQVQGSPEVALTCSGAMHGASCLLLTR
jgi:acetyl-CoA acetyltransferase